MTAPLISGRARRSVAALGAVSAGLLVLSACDKPTPLATVTVGTSSVSTEAPSGCKAEKGKDLALERVQECLTDPKGAKDIEYGHGDTLRLGVEPEVVEDGKRWQVVLDGQPVVDPTSNTYRSFPNVDIFATGNQGGSPASRRLGIVQLAEDGKPLAVWSYQLNLK
ncbi:DUF2771 domain-containing protein [Streptomyces sp. NPDC048603]|uniref:DUF2771 domain-containing protein n=1 Tax=Streptomyces sp. NPDC048603 TaxID=3365577 RepID=UPI00371DC12C